MKLTDLDKDWKQDITFTYKLGLIEYQCNVKYLPFGRENRNKYERKDLSEIYTPVFHFEFEALSTKEMIYQSHWIMPYFFGVVFEQSPGFFIGGNGSVSCKREWFCQKGFNR